MHKYSYHIFTLIALGLTSMVFHTNITFASFEDLVQELTQVKTSKTIESSGTQEASHDLFLQSLNNTQADKAGSIIDLLSQTTNNIHQYAQKTNQNCSLNQEDIANILYENLEITHIFYDTTNKPLSSSLTKNKSVIKSCEKLFSCLGNSKRITDQTREIALCTSIIGDQFSFNEKLKTHYNKITNINRNDNIYIDNVKKNGLFDIMIDIDNIDEILFDQKKGSYDTTEMIYYALPDSVNNTSNGGETTGAGGNGGLGGNQGNNTTSTEGGQTNNPGLEGSITTNTQQYQAIVDTNNQQGDGQQGSTISSEINSFLAEHPQNTSNPLPQQGGAISQTTLTQPICINDQNNDEGNNSSEDNDNSDGGDEGSFTQINEPYSPGVSIGGGDAIEDLEDLEDEIINILDDYLEHPGPNLGQDTIQFEDPGPLNPSQSCTSECADTSGVERLLCEGNCCIDSCQDFEDPVDKALCMSECVCGETSSTNDILRIKICRVPAQASEMKAGTTIHSVEEAINEINAIFSTLKHSGALIKRTKKKQFLDTSFSNTKFSDILAFDIFFSEKPIYNKIPLEKKQKELTQQYHNNKSINQSDGKIGDPQDKNKYTVISAETNAKARCEELGRSYDKITKQCIPKIDQSTINIIDNTYHSNYRFNDDIVKFLSQHSYLRDEIFNQFVEFKTTTQNLKAKADNAE